MVKGVQTNHPSPVRQTTVHLGHQFVPRLAVVRRIKSRGRNIRESDQPVHVLLLEPIDFPAAQQAIAVVKNFQLNWMFED